MTQLAINRSSDHYVNVLLDAEAYRERRNETLIHLAERLAQKAVRTGQEVALEPMPSYERKVIHTALVGNRRIKTYSRWRGSTSSYCDCPKSLKKFPTASDF